MALAQIVAGGQAIPMLTHADPIPGAATLTELRVVQPVVFASGEWLGGRLRAHVMLDGEAWTMEHGQLASGDFGEGYSDKRHPHTWGHELMLSAVDAVRLPAEIHWSLSAGKGFAPFGSDDPMNRPALIYPVNHHWSQILERAELIAGFSRGPVTLEAGLFNGDEPENPRQWPNWDRFGDSWSARLLVRPARGLELQGSYAHVPSPEHRGGAGLLHEKASVSARLDRSTSSGEWYGLAEWAYNDEGGGTFIYRSVLVETQLRRGRHRPYLRLEFTERPEENRLANDLFRSPRPHAENSNVGISRWNVVTAGYGITVGPAAWPLAFEGIAEGNWMKVTTVTGIFDPVLLFGRNDLWMASVALRITAGTMLHRMGRYGVTAGDGPMNHSMHGME